MLMSTTKFLFPAVLANAARRATVVDSQGALPPLKPHSGRVGDDTMQYLPPWALAYPEDQDDRDGDGGVGRSLSLVPAAPAAGQHMFEVTKGFHTYKICDTGEDNMSMYENLKFCNISNTTMPYVIFPWYITDKTNTGIYHDCPDTKDGCHELDLIGLGLESCLEWCGNAALLGDPCSDGGCVLSSFCRHTLEEENREGVCAPCPSEPLDCLAEATTASKKSCLNCYLMHHYLYWGETTVDDEVFLSYAMSSAPFYSTPGSVTGPLVDCSDLVLDRVATCPGAEDSICLIHDYVKDSFFYSLARKCEASGGLAMILYLSHSEYFSDDLPGEGYLAQPVNIPVVRISYNDGLLLTETKLGTDANVTTYDAWIDSWRAQYCSTTVPCIEEDTYCTFANGMDVGIWCDSCPEDPLDCLFPAQSGYAKTQNEVEACVAGCASDLEFGKSCKMCGQIKASSLEFGVDDPADKCRFCPMDDVKHPDRFVPLFSSDKTQIECWKVQAFFETVDLHRDTKNCKLAQSQNYICGCEGTGYAGANTQEKQNALKWAPRATAILSAMGSLSVLYDVVKVMRTGRGTLFHKLMAQMSVFDFVGSVALAFTSLPIPSEYYFAGAGGNEATCTTQGFFIQVGTVACYTNVSLAVYYFLVIQKGWSESRLRKVSLWLLFCPIVVGLVFAFAGIPFYGNMLLWCNNAAGWWPDIPVAIAITLSTVIMGSVCWEVHKTHMASRRWQQGGGGSGGPSLQSKVFWQSFWYLMSFYMTWPPYLVLQYLWASGQEYDNYGLILCAGMVVPLQGFWNFFVYARNRQMKRASARMTTATSSCMTLSLETLCCSILCHSTGHKSKAQNASPPELSISQDNH